MSVAFKFEYSSDELFSKEIKDSDFNPNGKITVNSATKDLVLRGLLEKRLEQLTLVESPTASERHLRKIEQAIELYAGARVSLGKAAELCSMYFDEIIEKVKRRGVKFDFGPRTLEEAEKEAEIIRKYKR